MEFYQTKRSQFNDISEFAAKQLPLHPTARYSNFPTTWKETRSQQYVPRPKRLKSDDSFFPCCLACVAQSEEKEDISESLWHRKAYAGWLQAEWFWDFGWTLPEEFVSFGVGITVPTAPIERDRVFVHKPDFSRGILDMTLQEHAQCGENQHEAKMMLDVSYGYVTFAGQLIGGSDGSWIAIAVPRITPFQDGKEIWKRYNFQEVQLLHNLPVLIHGAEIKVENSKVKLLGIDLN